MLVAQTWLHEEKFSDSLKVNIRPGRMMWLELKPVMRHVEGHFLGFLHGPGIRDAGRFSGTVTAPGLEGTLKDVITVRDEPIAAALAESLRASGLAGGQKEAGPVHADGDGLVSFHDAMAYLLAGETKASTHATG
ncbi:hypothetical protein ACWEPM_33885 [Streptomyces sp. NPDC004244]